MKLKQRNIFDLFPADVVRRCPLLSARKKGGVIDKMEESQKKFEKFIKPNTVEIVFGVIWIIIGAAGFVYGIISKLTNIGILALCFGLLFGIVFIMWGINKKKTYKNSKRGIQGASTRIVDTRNSVLTRAIRNMFIVMFMKEKCRKEFSA